MATVQNPPDQQNDEIDLRELLGTLVDHKWLIIVVTGLFLLGSLAYALLATPVYEADAVVQVEQKVPELPGLSAITQTLGASSSEATTEIALITSRSVLGKAVEALKFNVEVYPRHFPLFGGFVARHSMPATAGAVAPAMFGFNSYDWGGSTLDIFQLAVPLALEGKKLRFTAGQNGSFVLRDHHGELLLKGQVGQPAEGRGVKLQVKSLVANPGTEFDVICNNELAVINQLQQKDVVATEQGKDSGIIGLTYDNIDPVRATQLLDQISQFYVRQNVDRNSAEAANSLQFVKEQLPKIREALEKATAALNAFQNKAHSVDITMQTKGMLDQEVAVETSIQQLRMQQADMARRFTPEHPAYKALMEQLSQAEGQKAAMEKQVGNLPDTQQELLRLTRDVTVNDQTYTGLLNQAQQLDIARAGTVGNVRIIDPAAVDTTLPVKPKKAIVVVGGTFLGGFLAVAFVFIRQTLNRGIEDPAVIEDLGLPVYASVPLSVHQVDIEAVRERRKKPQVVAGQERRRATGSRARLLALEDPADLAIEAMRSLRTSLHFAMLEAKNNVLMISGASPSAGKTFISTNLAAVVAQAGQRVLLLDADMRRGSLHRVMGGKPTPGLSELLTGKATLEQALHATTLENLSFISRGHAPPNPSELLMHTNFRALINKLSGAYDIVIVDTPPILAVTDAAIIGSYAGTSLLVARFGVNQPREIALAKQRFEQNRVELKGAIFNAVERRAVGYYTYGYYDYRTDEKA